MYAYPCILCMCVFVCLQENVKCSKGVCISLYRYVCTCVNVLGLGMHRYHFFTNRYEYEYFYLCTTDTEYRYRYFLDLVSMKVQLIWRQILFYPLHIMSSL